MTFFYLDLQLRKKHEYCSMEDSSEAAPPVAPEVSATHDVPGVPADPVEPVVPDEPVPAGPTYKKIKIQVPRISSRDFQPKGEFQPVINELEQQELVFNGPGAKRDINRLVVKIKNIELEECIKRAKKYAMEQSVRFVLIKQQQQQQKQQLDLIKKQQALLLMCR